MRIWKMVTERTESQSIEYVVQLYDGIRELVSSDEVALGVLAEVCKGLRMQAIQAERSGHNGSAATEKQLEFLKDLGVKPKLGLTKEEATRLIDEALDKRDVVGPVYQRVSGRAFA